jgi:hypothetical protein
MELSVLQPFTFTRNFASGQQESPASEISCEQLQTSHRGTSMSASGISSSSFSQYPLGAPSNPYQQAYQQLAQDLKSGNLSAAQSDFSTLQKAFSQPATTSTTPSDPVTQAFNQLAADLKSGNLSASQQDFSTLQQDIQGVGSPSTNHFHNNHRLKTEIGNLEASTSPLPSSTSNILTAAQQAYSLQTQPPVPGGNGGLQTEPPIPGGSGLHQTEPPVSWPPSSIGGLINPEPPVFPLAVSLVA